MAGLRRLFISFAFVAGFAGGVSAQYPTQAISPFGIGTSNTIRPSEIHPYLNPYADSRLNPFLNPWAAGQDVSRRDAAIYFLEARRVSGGAFSGRIDDPRATGRLRPSGGSERLTRPPAAKGRAAASYFDRRVGTSVGAARYYDRQARPETRSPY